MLVEAHVLGVDDALDHVVADLVHLDAAAVLQIVLGDDRAVGVHDLGGLADEVGVRRVVVGKVLQPARDERAERHGEGRHEHRDEAEHAGDAEPDDMRAGVPPGPALADAHAVPPPRRYRQSNIIRKPAAWVAGITSVRTVPTYRVGRGSAAGPTAGGKR